MTKQQYQVTFQTINHMKTHQIILNCTHQYQIFSQVCMMRTDCIRRQISHNIHLKSIKL